MSMHKRWLFGVAVVVLAAGVAWGQQPGLPEGLPPTLGGIRAGDNADSIQVSQIVYRNVAKEITVKVPKTIVMDVNGMAVFRTVYEDVKQLVTVAEPTTEFRSVPLKDVEFYNVNWGRIAGADVVKKLKDKNAQPAVMLQRYVKADGESTFQRPDSFYLRALKEDTLIVVLPSLPLAPKLPAN
jgi:hypothetical protein